MKKSMLGLAALMLCGFLTAQAANLPKGYPATFQRSGMIDELPGDGNQTMVISDVRYLVAPNLSVHTLQLPKASLASLRIQQRIGFSLVGQGPGTKGTITEIWVLPKDYKP